jgi:hypothetical protein
MVVEGVAVGPAQSWCPDQLHNRVLYPFILILPSQLYVGRKPFNILLNNTTTKYHD